MLGEELIVISLSGLGCRSGWDWTAVTHMLLAVFLTMQNLKRRKFLKLIYYLNVYVSSLELVEKN